MPIYVYQTIPETVGEKPTYFEFQQSIKDPAFTVHPETGEPIRRVMLGGFGILSSTGGRRSQSTCGPGCACH